MKNPATLQRVTRHSQRGIVMIIALVVLVAMSLAGLALLRSMSTGVAIAGNVAFKQNATSVGDLGLEAARLWLVTEGAKPGELLNVSNTDEGYHAAWSAGFDPLTYDWGTGIKDYTADDGTGNRVRYVIHRLCSVEGSLSVAGQQCVIPTGEVEKGTGGGGASGPGVSAAIKRPYFRVTARVDGPRDTVSYVQMVMF
ncbi:MAG: hypothetical protein EOP39_22800 [Rubrivivax sp.]|nr:MAG: hypothetical protein EOP39_22800 [Rubrivivax sp.]